MRLARISSLALTAAMVFAASPGAAGLQAAPAAVRPAGAACANAAALADSLVLSAANPEASLSFAPGPASDSLALVGAQSASGPCVPLARVFGPTGVLLFSNGAAVTVHHGAEASAGDNGERFFRQYEAFGAGDPHPNLQGYSFVMATGISKAYGPGGTKTADHLAGIWRRGQGSVVASFARLSDGRFTKPRVLLASSRPLRSVSYFPNPDTAAGTLGLIQDNGGAINLITLRWSHRSLAGGGKTG